MERARAILAAVVLALVVTGCGGAARRSAPHQHADARASQPLIRELRAYLRGEGPFRPVRRPRVLRFGAIPVPGGTCPVSPFPGSCSLVPCRFYAQASPAVLTLAAPTVLRRGVAVPFRPGAPPSARPCLRPPRTLPVAAAVTSTFRSATS